MPGTRFAIYTRLSKDRTGDSTSPARQQRDLERLAEERDLTVTDVYTDTDSAYRSTVRPGYERLLVDMAAGRIDGVLVWKLDRLMRRIIEFSRFWTVAEANNVALVAKHDPVDTTTPLGLAVVYLLVAVAENESLNTSIRWQSKHTELAEGGRPSGGGCRPFGYKADQKTLVPEEAEEIAAAARRVLAGDSVRSIVMDWRERGIATVKGGEWTTTTVRGLLKSARISGQREHRGQIVGRAVWPAVITPDETAQLRAHFADPTRDSVGGKRARSYLLSGFLVCGECGAKMVTRPDRSTARYMCAVDRGGCNKLGINAPKTDDVVTEAFLHRVNTLSVTNALRYTDDECGRAAQDELEAVRDLEGRVAQLSRDHYVDGRIGREAYLAVNGRLEMELQAARDQVARRRPVDVFSGIDVADGGLADAWPGLPLDRRRAMLGSVVESVTVLPRGEVGNRFDPRRVSRSITWRI